MVNYFLGCCMIENSLIALGITFVLALTWLRINDYFAHKGWISSSLSRKIIHTGTGPIFVLCWLLFNDAPYNRYLAALIPLAITIQFALVGLGIMKDQSSVDSMSRTGDRREILRGPLFYGIVFVALTILFWKNSPIGIISLMIVSGGDGLADIIGKRSSGKPLPWSSRKTFVGSIAMFLGGFTFAFLVLAAFRAAGVFVGPIWKDIPKLVLLAFAGTMIESLPFSDIDNLTVPLITVLLGLLMY